MIKLTKTKINALNKMAEGGEATIYEYPPSQVLKAFKPHIDLNQKYQKVSRLLAASLPPEVVVPKEEVTVNNNFIGYTMDKIVDAEVVHQLSKIKYLKIAGVNNRDILSIVIDIGKTINTLHKVGVVLGDISDYNILFDKTSAKFIDVDSWGIGNLRPDAFTEIFTAPECYKSTIELTPSSDLFSYCVLAFNLLARIHPFNGTFKKDANMSTLERIMKGISVLGKEDITIPKMVPSWDWLSPDLKNAFLEVFEKGSRANVLPVLEEQLYNSKLCATHGIYYYAKYTECPLCSGSAKVLITPVTIKVTASSGGPVISIIFEEHDLKVIINKNIFISSKDEAVHIPTKRRIKIPRGKHVEFTSDGQFAFLVTRDTIEVIDRTGKSTSLIERMYDTYFQAVGLDFYYIDKDSNLVAITPTAKGNIKRTIAQTYNPLFSVSEEGEVFLASLYPKKAVVLVGNRNFEVAYEGRIKEYAIKQDPITKKWLFVYQLPNGRFRTMVFSNKSIEYDSDILNYNPIPLDGICFFNSTIYDPGDGKIVGTSYTKSTAKEFACAVVDGSSRLEFKDGGFIITNNDKIYNFK